MNLRQLEAFRATMTCGSITGASKLLHISQPSVSRLIAELERSIGFQLFIRTGHGLTATIEARKFSHSVDSMFLGLDKLRGVAESICNANDMTVSLSVIPAFAHTMMPEAVAKLRTARPSVHLEIAIQNTPEIVDAILLQKLDLGVICPTRHYDGLYYIYQTSVEYVCLLPTSHHLADAQTQKEVDIVKLSAGTEVILAPENAFQFSDSDAFKQLVEKGQIISHSGPAIASIARVAGLVSIVDPYTAAIECLVGSVIARPIKQQINYPVALVTRSVDALSTVGLELADSLISQIGD